MADGRYARETRSASSRDIAIFRFSRRRLSIIMEYRIKCLTAMRFRDTICVIMLNIVWRSVVVLQRYRNFSRFSLVIRKNSLVDRASYGIALLQLDTTE